VVSSVSVYADSRHPGLDEKAAVLAAYAGESFTDAVHYGPAKVACEQAYLERMGADRVLLCRPGLIGGPGDVSDRTGWWPLHFYQCALAGQQAWVPQADGLYAQIIDVRDLAQWLVHAADTRLHGAVNLVGESVALSALLDVALRVADEAVRQAAEGKRAALASHHAHEKGQRPVTMLPDDWLLNQGVSPWAGPMSLPLWVPGPDAAGFGRRSDVLALSAGLLRRPLNETLADALAWELSRPAPVARRAGMGAEQALALLQRWQARIAPKETQAR
jgi:2'-hydroxyisoflavone reductase